MPRAGYVVASVTLSDVADLCDMRALLQPEAAAQAARFGLPARDAARLEELCEDDADDQLGGPHFEERLRDNYEFESIIANGSVQVTTRVRPAGRRRNTFRVRSTGRGHLRPLRSRSTLSGSSGT